MTEVFRARSRVANEIRRAKRRQDPADQVRVADARRALAEAKLESYIRSIVASAPELTQQQCDRLAALFGVTVPERAVPALGGREAIR